MTPRMKATRRTRSRGRASAVVLAGLALGVVSAAPAMAHVTVSADQPHAGSYAVLTFSVPHGCEGSSTTKVSIQVPEGINAVTPTRNGLWEVDKQMADLDTPIEDSHGNQITERVAEVVYTTDDPLPDGYRDAFELSLQLPVEAAGTTVAFPTVQTCEQGEAAWVQVPADGQDPDELELPAPTIEVDAAVDEDADPRADEPVDDVGGGTDDLDLLPWVISSLVVGVLGLAVGGAAWLRGRPRA